MYAIKCLFSVVTISGGTGKGALSSLHSPACVVFEEKSEKSCQPSLTDVSLISGLASSLPLLHETFKQCHLNFDYKNLSLT